jgi:hypothetical protein
MNHRSDDAPGEKRPQSMPIASAAARGRVQLTQRGGRGLFGGAAFDACTLVRAQVVGVDRETGVAMQADGAGFEADFAAPVVADMKAADIGFVTVNGINRLEVVDIGPPDGEPSPSPSDSMVILVHTSPGGNPALGSCSRTESAIEIECSRES